ncbi:MAG: ADP-ribosylglycohydrolase family protein [Actinomycetota bacterium]|nr:MAG: ADP-ribosylglycohydrolase family protein [Actinomycetota bacterium]
MTASEPSLHDRAVGAVVGSAAADALGAPYEFGLPGQYSARFPEPALDGPGEQVGGGGFGWAPGEFTDDTQMAIVQGESVLVCDGVDPRDLFERFRIWSLDATDVGVQTNAVLSSPLGWRRAALDHYSRHPDRSAGNGALMRSTPTAVRFASSTAQATVDAARAASAVTHADPAAGWGTALYHLMIRAALHGRSPFDTLAAALEHLPADQQRFHEVLHPSWEPSHSRLSNSTVWSCLAQAVWAVRTTTTYSEAVVAAIDLGGDTDTVAAVTGGLAGALYGIASVPERWTMPLHGHITTAAGRRTYRLVDLQGLTYRLLDTASS